MTGYIGMPASESILDGSNGESRLLGDAFGTPMVK